MLVKIKNVLENNNNNNNNKEQGDDIENYIYDFKGEGITSNPRSSR